jgi:hypothetical protein
LIDAAQNDSDVPVRYNYFTRIKGNPDRKAYDEDMTIHPQ